MAIKVKAIELCRCEYCDAEDPKVQLKADQSGDVQMELFVLHIQCVFKISKMDYIGKPLTDFKMQKNE